MVFSPERLKRIRMGLGITKADAARKLHLTAMAYGRYENGERVPSYQMIHYISQVLGTSCEYLCCETEDPSPDTITISKVQDPDLFKIVQDTREMNPEMRSRLLAYCRELKQ